MEIDCSVPCPIFLKILNSCPSRPIDIFQIGQAELFEIAMVMLSMSPYIASFLCLLSTTYYKTTRGVVILMMIISQNFMIEIIKGSLRDPRPNYKCNKQFGNPSNHATFFTSLIIWVLMEQFLLHRRFRFSNLALKLLLFFSFPFIIYSRVYLNYHSTEQISNGIILGVIMGVVWFLIVDGFILKRDNPFKRIFIKLQLKNNLSHEEFCFDENQPDLYKKLLELNKQQDELSKIKSQLKDFRENVESLDFLKAEKEKHSKKSD